ncbi:tyrosine-type recombinase/integrase [Streptomyces albus]|uniref:tyrosine-type recombinase/integrase n=1 Tax=Streptomyces albus TaxID=1888 RepID=UPI003F1B6E9D
MDAPGQNLGGGVCVVQGALVGGLPEKAAGIVAGGLGVGERGRQSVPSRAVDDLIRVFGDGLTYVGPHGGPPLGVGACVRRARSGVLLRLARRRPEEAQGLVARRRPAVDGGALRASGPRPDAAEGDRLYALFHLCGTRGLRRGEGVGQEWEYVDLEARITPARAITVHGWDPYEDDPKTDGSAATIALDSVNVAVLRAHRARQQAEREAAGPAWQETGEVFTNEDGSSLHPETASEALRRILASTDLPPITFHDLRHVAATLVHAGGGDLHTIKETLRHSAILLASDTYTILLPEVDRSAAEAGVRLRSPAHGRRARHTATNGAGSWRPAPRSPRESPGLFADVLAHPLTHRSRTAPRNAGAPGPIVSVRALPRRSEG